MDIESMDTSLREFKTDANLKKLLVRTRLEMEEEFTSGNIKKSVLWDKVLEKMKEEYPNLNLTKEQITRKYLNFLTTYRRIKQRHKESGQNVTTWELFDDFDKMYGLSFVENPSQDESTYMILNDMKYDSCDDVPESFISSAKNGKYINDILEFLEEEAVNDQKRHEEILAIEEQKLQMEEEEIIAMIELKNSLEKAINSK